VPDSKVSRPGVIPGPTVIVRMKRERDWRQRAARRHSCRRAYPKIPFDSYALFFTQTGVRTCNPPQSIARANTIRASA
jgi:hypothetical protein